MVGVALLVGFFVWLAIVMLSGVVDRLYCQWKEHRDRN